ncbi:hypothetical protein AB0G35_35035 [Streptomyces sp. NPDC021749]|uniref:hypothetical protein n=1 Tax=Streptomyces sp. NPDC021749 TaxID=3154905 RepID=UPI0033D2BE33
MERHGTLRRGLRFGLRVGVFHAVPFAVLSGMAGISAFFSPPEPTEFAAGLWRVLAAVGGSLAVGALLGLVTGGLLLVVPRWLRTSTVLRGLLTALAGGTVYLGEVVVVTEATDGGYAPIALILLMVPVIAAVTAAHSGDIAGLSRYHAWLWSPARRPSATHT